MCSFIFYSSAARTCNASAWDSHVRRGPDATELLSVNGRIFTHNLLALNGSYVTQPVYIESKGYIVFFNGEIYNPDIIYHFGGNDTKFLVDLLENTDSIEDAVRILDGEFVICVYSIADDILNIATDLFRTKPVWVGYSPIDNEWSASTYASGADSLCKPYKCEIPGNRLLRICLSSNSVLENKPIHDFYKIESETTFKDWCSLFDAALVKRAPRTGRLLIPVSSGFDSGLIAYRCKDLGMDPALLSIISCEDQEIMQLRQEQLGISFIEITHTSYNESLQKVLQTVENYSYTKHQPLLDIASLHQDPGTVGLYTVLQHGKEIGCKVSYSGQGADEIYSDYGFQGLPVANVSSLAGRYPSDMSTVLPWKNLFSGTQRAYLMKDEHVAGSLGMESRYPFLDRELFMCFLALPAEIKNSYYKGPIGRWTAELGIPVASGKLGFSANRGLAP